MSLRAWWEGGPSPMPPKTLRKWTSRPWFRPEGASRPEAPPAVAATPGETLLLGVRDGQGELHLLVWDATAPQGRLRGEAEAALRAAHARATWYAPLLLQHGHAPAQPHIDWFPTREQPPSYLDGASYGLAFALALASLASRTPLPTDLVATACLAPGDRLLRVEGLAAKLEALHRGAPGVRRVLVAEQQADEAAPLGARFGFEILPVATLAAAFREALPDHEPRLADALAQHEEHREAFQALERVTLGAAGGQRVLPWENIAKTLAALTASLPADLRARAEFARRVAARHHGARDVHLAWTSRADWPHRQVWLARLRQVVQAATDDAGDDALTARYADDAWAEVGPAGERDLETLRLAGAIGRAWAALGRLDEAARLLDDVSQEWLTLDLPDEASFALTELLRVQSARGDASLAIDRARQWLGESVTSAVARAYVTTALARALLVRRGTTEADAEEALCLLAEARLDPHDFPANHHIQPIRRRWRARALLQLGRERESDSERGQLPDSGRANVFLHLAELDHALATGADASPWADRLDRRERERLDGCLPADRARFAWYADAWRY